MSAEQIVDLKDTFVEIPSGAFAMGGDTELDNKPIHDVEISAFRLTKFHVTNAQYAAFCAATDHHLPEFWNRAGFHCGPSHPNHPVVGISWLDAGAFAEWV